VYLPSYRGKVSSVDTANHNARRTTQKISVVRHEPSEHGRHEDKDGGGSSKPAWVTAPPWWKSPPQEAANAGNQPWPNDPVNANNYQANVLDPENFPLGNMDDPVDFPGLADPNAAYDPM